MRSNKDLRERKILKMHYRLIRSAIKISDIILKDDLSYDESTILCLVLMGRRDISERTSKKKQAKLTEYIESNIKPNPSKLAHITMINYLYDDLDDNDIDMFNLTMFRVKIGDIAKKTKRLVPIAELQSVVDKFVSTICWQRVLFKAAEIEIEKWKEAQIKINRVYTAVIIEEERMISNEEESMMYFLNLGIVLIISKLEKSQNAHLYREDIDDITFNGLIDYCMKNKIMVKQTGVLTKFPCTCNH